MRLARTADSTLTDSQWRANGPRPVSASRGELAEIEVELQASQIYRYSSIFSAMEGIIEDSRSFVTAELYAQMRGGLKAVSNVLQQMLIGLIPVKCRAVDYRVVRANGKSLIVHRRILDQIPSEQLPKHEELYVTGVAEETLFWKDVRRFCSQGLSTVSCFV
jgi:hypothetical protein